MGAHKDRIVGASLAFFAKNFDNILLHRARDGRLYWWDLKRVRFTERNCAPAET
jgi:hypothetical protein